MKQLAFFAVNPKESKASRKRWF